MKRSLVALLVLITACEAVLVAYGLPYLQSIYILSSTQTSLLIVILMSCAGIVATGAYEYTVAHPWQNFAELLEQTWKKSNSLKTVDASHLPAELRNILKLIQTFTEYSSQRIAELESKSGYGDTYYRLITTISHQLRTPITGLRWALGSLYDDATKGVVPDPALITSAIAAAGRIGMIVEELLIGVNENAEKDKVFETVDIEKSIDNVLAECILSAREKDVAISIIRKINPIPLIQGISHEIRFVLNSLITNSIAYSEKGGTVTVTLEQAGSFVRITVHNDGLTIPENEKTMIFSQFSRGTAAIRTNPEGSGLGLYLTRQIIIDHGGEISFESIPSKGTSFVISLPLSHTGQLETSVHY